MSAAASILSIYHTLPNDLAVANLNIEPRGVDFYFFHTLYYGLGSETWLPTASPGYYRMYD
jgi:hypothetical protein